MKFAGQIFEVTTRLSGERFGEDDKDELRRRFIADYEAEFGSGTAWTEAEILLVNSRVRAIGRTDAQDIVDDADAEDHRLDQREIVDPATGRPVTVDVHRGFRTVGKANGPCLLEEPDTTVFIPAGATVEVVDGGHFLIRLDNA